MSREINSNRHSVYSLKYHLVVITKYRHKCITPKMLDELEKIFTRLLNDKDCEVLEFGGEEDHIHILFETPPQIQLSKLVNTLKTVSSRLIKKTMKNI
nr:IS200/IS605 family transposase [Acetohalobium arabaticum]